MTGGRFGAKVRAADETRANLVYTNGSELVAYLRAAKPKFAWQSIAIFLVFLGITIFVLYPVASGTLSKTNDAGCCSACEVILFPAHKVRGQLPSCL